MTAPSSSVCHKQKVPAHCATVRYNFVGPGSDRGLVFSTGYATFQNGHWLVAKVTICDLLGSFYEIVGKHRIPPGC